MSKTRERLIEVARQLFLRKGVENTTMLDIANASEKGRRTIYTYFRNKREIHQAVIESESERMVSRQRRIQAEDIPPLNKLEAFMRARLEMLRCPTSQHRRDGIPLLSFIDGGRIGKTRRLAAQKEMEILRCIIDEGIEKGEFDPQQARRLSPLLVMVMQGIDSAVSCDNIEALGFQCDVSLEMIIEFILCGIAPGRGVSSESQYLSHD